jgi:hypothetical protein
MNNNIDTNNITNDVSSDNNNDNVNNIENISISIPSPLIRQHSASGNPLLGVGSGISSLITISSILGL